MYCHTTFTIPPKLHSEINTSLPYGFTQGVHYVHAADWATGERASLYIVSYENNERGFPISFRFFFPIDSKKLTYVCRFLLLILSNE